MKNRISFTIVESKTSQDNVTKYILEDTKFGKNEVAVIQKDSKNILCLPTQTNCRMGCTFCHLTGTTRPSKNLSSIWLISTVHFMTDLIPSLTDKRLLISFMGAGEPLLNHKSIQEAMSELHVQYSSIRFGVCTMMPDIGLMEKFIEWSVANSEVSVKLHLSVHGIGSRKAIIKSIVGISKAISLLQRFHRITGNPIEYHYTLVAGVNDSAEELNAFHRLTLGAPSTLKFLTLSENNGCKATSLSEEEILTFFPGQTVEFYNPPGRDVGASCGMFDRDLYNI